MLLWEREGESPQSWTAVTLSLTFLEEGDWEDGGTTVAESSGEWFINLWQSEFRPGHGTLWLISILC